MLTYVSRFLSGDLEPFWPHVTLLSLAVLASIAVGGGIILERPKYPPSVHRVAFWLVVVGIAIEAVCTIFLFVFDEGVSNSHQRTIEQMLTHRHLSAAQKEGLAAVAKRFPSLNFLTITAFDAESWDFVMEIAAELKNGGWNWIPCDGSLPKLIPIDGRPMSCATILDHIQVDGSQVHAEIVSSLVNALKDPRVIGMDDVRPEISAAFPTTAIMVGTKR